MENRAAALFREIHKNTWLKRLTAEGKKVLIGPKKSERSWVVFCVHDDTEALLEGYAEPRMAASHNPEWVFSLQTTQHISHALVPNECEYEFVITLSDEVIRFHAISWEIMQEWVDTLRAKLREMRILSPRENLYTKLPEIRAPLLPTRDPTSPLPATPPVPAAIVPGIERVVPPNTSMQDSQNGTSESASAAVAINDPSNVVTTTTPLPAITSSIPSASMSNTLSQNLLNLLSDPISTYSVQVTESSTTDESLSENEDNFLAELPSTSSGKNTAEENCHSPIKTARYSAGAQDDSQPSLAQTFTHNVLSDPNTCPSTSVQHINLSKSRSVAAVSSLKENSVRVDVNSRDEELHLNGNNSGRHLFENSASASEPNTPAKLKTISIPRPQTNRSISLNDRQQNTRSTVILHPESDKSQNNVTEVDVSAADATVSTTSGGDNDASDDVGGTNITIIQVSNPLQSRLQENAAEIFCFPPTTEVVSLAQEEFKSNVQIIPSSTSVVPSTSSSLRANLANNQYSIPNKINKSNRNQNSNHTSSSSSSAIAANSVNKVTTVRVSGAGSSIPNTYGKLNSTTSTKKLILSANPSGVTNITVGNSSPEQSLPHYEKVFLSSSSSPLQVVTASSSQSAQSSKPIPATRTVSNPTSKQSKTKPSVKPRPITTKKTVPHENTQSSASSSNNTVEATSSHSLALAHTPGQREEHKSPVVLRRKNQNENTPPHLANRAFLTRGLTEAVITARPSRIDTKNLRERSKPSSARDDNQNSAAGKNGNSLGLQNNNMERTRSESVEQRRRSSSVSEVQPSSRSSRQNNLGVTSRNPGNSGQPFRTNIQDNLSSKRLTLREQQVLHLRREIMHPGGVRLQLRRKDCIGSIAFVEAFGAIWIAGWKQKDHPMLYNALHIGDQLLSIAGNVVNTAAEANKTIRNTNTLFLEILIRRVPFGRVYAIRRELDGQCLGLIRDGNTATIVDVVPNSLAARFGLPPKAQSCDGLSLTFWVLTEINGRPLNLFFKENEVRDRLNSVGRDISILVQPSDLIAKLKKQLKSMRSYKDYIVQ